MFKCYNEVQTHHVGEGEGPLVVVYQVLSHDVSVFITAERRRAALQYNKTPALRVEGLKPEEGAGVIRRETILLVHNRALSLFTLYLKNRK